MGVMASCSPDENDWSTDPSAKRLYSPSSLEAVIDSFSLDMTVTIGAVANAAKYQVQFSQQPLLSGFDETEGIPTVETEGTEVTIPRSDPRLGEGGIKENAIYYVRARVIDANGNKSKWYSNGMLYDDGFISDESIADLLKKNAAYRVPAPAGLWITGIEEHSMKLNWYMLPTSSSKAERAYCGAPSYIINETLKNEGAEESVYKHSITEEELEAYIYEWADLEVGKAYEFSLYDVNGTRIGNATESTEYAPNMDLAMSITVNDINNDVVVNPETGEEISGKAAFMTKGTPYTIASEKDFNEKKFVVTFNNETAGGWTESRNDWVSNPVNRALNFDIRAQVKKNTTVEFSFPSKGRLYIYGYGDTTDQLTQDGQDVQEFTTSSIKQKIPTVDDESVTQNAYISYKLRVVEGPGVLKIDNAYSMYFFGFCFVPDDPNAGNE